MIDGEAGGSDSNALTKSLLADYAAGALSEPFAVLVAAYRQMQGKSPPGAVPLANVERSPRPPASADPIGAIMPLALRSYVARQHGALETLEWRALLPGIERCRISRAGGTEAFLLRCRPGSAIPRHRHVGREAALVLQGGYHDAFGHYGVGDIAVADYTVEHRPVVDRTDACIILVVLEAPVRLTGLLGRLVQRIFGF